MENKRNSASIAGAWDGVRTDGREAGRSEPGLDVTASAWFERRVSASTRRRFLASAGTSALAIAGLRVGAAWAQQSSGPGPAVTARQPLTGTLTVDMHSHAGRFVRDNTAFEPVAEPMRAGGLAVACLAIVADSPTHRVFPDRRIHPVRAPEPGELYAWSRAAFARLLRLAQEQQLHVVGDVVQFARRPRPGRP